MPPDPESFVSRYRIHEKLGEGGMGVVYRATDLNLRRPVALKILGDSYLARKKFRARFLREARTAAALNHPGICTIHEVGEVPADLHIDIESEPRLITSGTPYLTMEYVEGRTLADRLRQGGPLPLPELLEVAVQVAEALAEAHSHHIVHRDLKPANIMLGPGGRVKILDFGLAKPVDGADGDSDESPVVSGAETITRNITGEGKVFGTVAYMSPEQALGKTAGTRSDIFSLGIMLFELCVGRRPFQGESSTSTVAKILEAEPESAVSARPALPQEMDRILQRCLRKNPEDRYDTGDLVVALEELRDTGSGSGRWRLPLSGIAVAAVLSISALLMFMSRDNTVPPDPPPAAPAAVPAASVVAVLPFAVQGSPEFGYLGEGLVTLLSTTLDGAGELRSVDARAVLGCVAKEPSYTPSAENGVHVAGKLGAGRFVLGDVVEAGGRLRIRADLFDTRQPNTSVAQATVEGTAADLFSLVDDLTGRLLASQFGDPGARVARIAAVTTESVPALKAYLEGEKELRAGRFAAALAAFENAVSLDDQFALAYYRMSIAAEWLTRAELTQTSAEKAFQLSSRLSDHDRSLLEAYLAWHRGDGNSAEALYRAIVGSYPDDVEAWFQLGEVLFHYGPPQGRSIIESKPAWDRVLEFEDEHALALMHLARIAALERRFPDMRALIDKILALNPSSERRLPLLALRAFVDGDTAVAAQVKDELRGVKAQIVSQAAWEVAVFAGDHDGAREIYDVLAEPDRSRETRTFAMGMQAYLDAARGRFDDAWEGLRQARRLDPVTAMEHHALLATMPHVQADPSELKALLLEVESWDAGSTSPSPTQDLSTSVHNEVHPFLRSFLLGLLYTCVGQPEAALPFAVDLETREGTERARHLGHNLAIGLRGRIAWEQGDRNSALSILESGGMNQNYIFVLSSPFFSLSQQRYLRGQALEEGGLHEDALAWFSSFEGYSVYDLVHIGPALVEQARILEAHGRKPEAMARYRRFLDLWEGCDDSVQPQVEAARARIAALSDS